MSKRIKVILLAVLVVFLGFMRDYLFYNVNWVYKTLTEGRMLQARDEFHFLLDWEPGKIVILKWALTMTFFGLFGLLTWVTIRIAFQNKLYNKIALLVYAGMLAISGLLYVIYYALGSPLEMYLVIRTIMGVGQSFLPLMLLGLAFKFLPQSQKIN